MCRETRILNFVQKVKTNRENREKLSAFLPIIDKIGSTFSDFRGSKNQNFMGEHAPAAP